MWCRCLVSVKQGHNVFSQAGLVVFMTFLHISSLNLRNGLKYLLEILPLLAAANVLGNSLFC